jgi:Ca2+-dependent lipid-binding protein
MSELVLHIRLREGVDIPSLDLVGKSDPFCLIQLSSSAQVFRTKVIENSSKPVWNEDFQVNVHDPAKDTLHIQMRDDDDASEDDLISKTKIALSTLTPGTVTDLWIDMEPIRVKHGGKIHVQLALLPADETPAFPPF